jgi:hypothetical protein
MKNPDTDLRESETDRKKLKLFIVGESSGDPEDWLSDCRRSLVIANDAAEAVDLAGNWPLDTSKVAELTLSETGILFNYRDSSGDD